MENKEFIQFIYELAQKNTEHIAVLNDEVGQIAKDIEWLVKFFWVAVTTILGTFITSIWTLYKTHKNGGKR